MRASPFREESSRDPEREAMQPEAAKSPFPEPLTAGAGGEREGGREARRQGEGRGPGARGLGDAQSSVRKGIWKFHLGFQFEGGERLGA